MRHGTRGGPAVLPLEALPRPQTIPLSLAQKRMWFVNQFDVTSAAYNVAIAIRLRGRLDVAVLAGAITDVLTRHESLRTLFPMVEGVPAQVIVEPGEALGALPVVAANAEAVLGRSNVSPRGGASTSRRLHRSGGTDRGRRRRSRPDRGRPSHLRRRILDGTVGVRRDERVLGKASR